MRLLLRDRTTATPRSFVLQIASLLVLLFLSPIALVAQPAAADSSAHAVLSVFSAQAGRTVRVNGKALGKTPLRYLVLPAGPYEVIVQAASATSWLEEDWHTRVSLQPGDSLSLLARTVKGFRINAVPQGAQVWSAGKLLGTTPYIFRLPENETADLEVKHPAFQTAIVNVGGSGGELTQKWNYEVVLQRDLHATAMQARAATEQHSRVSHYRKLAYLSAALSAAAGVGSVLLKREADDTYAQYLVTGNPTLRDNYFARAQRYDRYYGAAFAAFEVSFAFSFYGFLKSLK